MTIRITHFFAKAQLVSAEQPLPELSERDILELPKRWRSMPSSFLKPCNGSCNG